VNARHYALKGRQTMGHHEQSWHMGWIAATIAFVAAALLIIDIAVHRGETLGDVLGVATPAAAQASTVLA
jgi:hypothetical protein